MLDRRRVRSGLVTLTLLIVVGPSGPPLGAQELADARLRGHVVRADEPLAQGTVVLHRVSPGAAGEVDSTRLASDGRFELALPTVPDPGRSEVYFASIRHQGILYFGAPITRAAQLDSAYTIEVYDTLGAPDGGATLPVSHRTIFLEEAEEGWRVTDLFEVENEGERTLVGTGGGVVWSHPLPEGARDFEVGEGELPPDAIAITGGVLRVGAPIPPGRRIVVVRYTAPSLELSFPLPGITERMELLVREPAPALEISALSAAGPVEAEAGNTYRVYEGNGLEDAVVTVRPGEDEGGVPIAWVAVVVGLLLGVAGVVALKLPGRDGGEAEAAVSSRPEVGRPVEGGDLPGRRERLLLEIARLDEAFEARESGESLDAAERQQAEAGYRKRRRELVARVRALDREAGR